MISQKTAFNNTQHSWINTYSDLKLRTLTSKEAVKKSMKEEEISFKSNTSTVIWGLFRNFCTWLCKNGMYQVHCIKHIFLETVPSFLNTMILPNIPCMILHNIDTSSSNSNLHPFKPNFETESKKPAADIMQLSHCFERRFHVQCGNLVGTVGTVSHSTGWHIITRRVL